MAKALSRKATIAKMAKDSAVLCLTHGHGFTIEPHGLAVTRKAGDDMTKQHDLFGGLNAPEAIELVPNDDGLFPGMSQTWRVAT